MELYNNFISNIQKDLNIISYKIDTSIGDGIVSLLYLLICVFVVIWCSYKNPYWSYILLILLIMIFLSIYTNKEFTKVNIMKKLLNYIIKPVCILFIILDNLFKHIIKTHELSHGEIAMIGLGIILLIILFIAFLNFFENKIKCKYDLEKIKTNNLSNFNNDNISKTGENECTKLDLNKCYSLKDLQPCFEQLKNNKDSSKCNYCLDYSYDTKNCNNIFNKEDCMGDCEYDTSSKVCRYNCSQYKDEDKCKEDNNCKYDSSNEKCITKEFMNSKRLCSSDLNDNDYNFITTDDCSTLTTSDECEQNNKCYYDKTKNKCINDSMVMCKSKNYCENELNTSYCHQMPDFDIYLWVYLIINIISCLVIIIFYYKNCISNKSFVLIILLINIFCLILGIFLQNTGYSDFNSSAEYS